MIISDTIHPTKCIYYTGAMLLRYIEDNGVTEVSTLYVEMRKEYNMSYPIFLLSLDWLYLINAAKVNQKGEVQLCS